MAHILSTTNKHRSVADYKILFLIQFEYTKRHKVIQDGFFI